MSSGDPAMLRAIKGVCTVDTDSSGNVVLDRFGMYDLPVKAVNDDGNSAVAIGDAVFYNASDTVRLSKKQSGHFFGLAMEAITAGHTDPIRTSRRTRGGRTSPTTRYATKLDRDHIFENSRRNPSTSLLAGGAPWGPRLPNIMQFQENIFDTTSRAPRRSTRPP